MLIFCYQITISIKLEHPTPNADITAMNVIKNESTLARRDKRIPIISKVYDNVFKQIECRWAFAANRVNPEAFFRADFRCQSVNGCCHSGAGIEACEKPKSKFFDCWKIYTMHTHTLTRTSHTLALFAERNFCSHSIEPNQITAKNGNGSL